MTPLDVDRLRAETPGCRERLHLNNAGAALMPEPVVRTIREHFELEARIGGYEAAELREREVGAAYEAVARLLGTRARNVAMTENATLSTLVALSSIPFEAGDVVLTTENDYVATQMQLLSLRRRRGIELLRAPERPEGGVDVEAMAALVRRRRPRLVAVTQAPTSSGLVQDVAAVGAVCREEDVLFLVDACQSIGQMPVDVEAIGCDFLSSTARKFLRGPRGAGFLFVSDRVLARGLEPLYPDLRAAEWTAADDYRIEPGARRFENWEFAWGLVLATGEAARYATALGLEAIRDRVRRLARRLRSGLAETPGVRVLDRGRELGAVVTAWVEGWQPPELVAALRERRINTSAQPRGYALLDYDRKGVSGALRLSPHYYNSEDEVDAALEALRELVGERRCNFSTTS